MILCKRSVESKVGPLRVPTILLIYLKKVGLVEQEQIFIFPEGS